ncbi:hypothetical protein BT69DRAFT_1286501, partial [Atractiella rhizophila]
ARLDLGRERDGGTGSLVFKPLSPIACPLAKLQTSVASATPIPTTHSKPPTPTASSGKTKRSMPPSNGVLNKRIVSSPTPSNTSTTTGARRAISPVVALTKRSHSHSQSTTHRAKKNVSPISPRRVGGAVGPSPPIGSKPALQKGAPKPSLSRRSTAPQPLVDLPYPGYVNPLRPLPPLNPPPAEPERRSQQIWGETARRKILNIPPPIKGDPLKVVKGFEIVPSEDETPSTSLPLLQPMANGSKVKGKEKELVPQRRTASLGASGLKPMQPIVKALQPLQPIHSQPSTTSTSASSAAPLACAETKKKALPPPLKAAPVLLETTDAEEDDLDSLWSSEGEEEELNSEDERQTALQKEWDEHNRDKETWFVKRPVSMVDVTTRPSALTAIFHPSQVDEDVRIKAVFHRNKSERDLLTGLQASKSTTALEVKGNGELSKAKGSLPLGARGGLSALRPMTAVTPATAGPPQPRPIPGPSRLGGKPAGIELESDDEDEEEEDAEAKEQKQRYQVKIDRRDRERLEGLMAPPLSPRTTKRNMLAGEFSEGLWQNLIRERHARRGNGTGLWLWELGKAMALKSGATVGDVSKTQVLGTSVSLPPGKDIRDIEDRLGPAPEVTPEPGTIMVNGRRRKIVPVEERLKKFTKILKDKSVAADKNQRREMANKYLRRNDRRQNGQEDYDDGLETQSEIGDDEEETPWQERFGQSYHTSGW